MKRVRWFTILSICIGVLALSACGGAKNGGGKGASVSKNGLVADVSSPKVEKGPKFVTTSVKVKVGGRAGRHLTLEWGLVDALQGNESQTERVVRRYVTTANVVTHNEQVKIPNSVVVTPYLVHFVLYAPDGTYLDSVDTAEFGKGS